MGQLLAQICPPRPSLLRHSLTLAILVRLPPDKNPGLLVSVVELSGPAQA